MGNYSPNVVTMKVSYLKELLGNEYNSYLKEVQYKINNGIIKIYKK